MDELCKLQEDIEFYESEKTKVSNIIKVLENFENVLIQGGNNLQNSLKVVGLFRLEDILVIKDLCARQLQIYNFFIEELKNNITEEEIKICGKVWFKN